MSWVFLHLDKKIKRFLKDRTRRGQEVHLYKYNALLEQQGNGNHVLSHISTEGGVLGVATTRIALDPMLSGQVIYFSQHE